MTAGIEVHPTAWQDVILVCHKCGKKLDDGGFGPDGDQSLVRALRQALRAAGRRREVRVMETRCMGLCPKRAVALVRAGRPGEILAVPAGTPAQAVLDRDAG